MTWALRAASALLLFAALALPPHSASATEAFSGARDLRGWCGNMAVDDVHWGLCVGSITAVHDTVMTYQGFDDMNQLVCTNETTTRGDVVTRVMQYMDDHPEDMEYSLGDVVLAALIEYYPCE
ncbi:Rap1a/Tai family immunity protein [Magnetovibrio sp.]|uniref:Rap1a/Tai family immunity protein n=1 Tax=Magnetovibrio sp. TaxID=2024836 RepID=UPI002F95EFE1